MNEEARLVESFGYSINAAQELQKKSKECAYSAEFLYSQLRHAVNVIESLSKQLEQVTRERDALLNELRGECNLCTHWQECLDGVYSGVRVDDSCWEWKGVEVEE